MTFFPELAYFANQANRPRSIFISEGSYVAWNHWLNHYFMDRCWKFAHKYVNLNHNLAAKRFKWIIHIFVTCA